MTLDAWYRRLSNNKSRNDYAYEVAKIETLGGSLRNQLTPLPQAAQPNVTKPATNPYPPALARRQQKASPTSIQNYQIFIAKGNDASKVVDENGDRQAWPYLG